MSIDEYKKVFSENLKRYMKQYNKSQVDIITDLNLNKSAVSSWVNGTRLPRMDKVEMLADYFHINKSDLIEEHDGEAQGYYFDIEAGQLAQEMFDRPEMRVLFDASRNVSKEDILDVANLLKKLKSDEDD